MNFIISNFKLSHKRFIAKLIATIVAITVKAVIAATAPTALATSLQTAQQIVTCKTLHLKYKNKLV